MVGMRREEPKTLAVVDLVEKLSEQSSLYFYRPCAPLPARVQRGTC
jgi:hypothetical protein